MPQPWRARSVVLLAFFAFAFANFGRAQSPAATATSGMLSGDVSDPTGAKVPHAAVHLEGPSFARDLTTDKAGRFSLLLPIGDYDLTVLSPGFAPFLDRVHIAAPAEPLHLAVSLVIAAVVERITVPIASGSTSADDNASALVFQGADLQTFSDDDATFQKEILALAGNGLSTPQLFVNGFSGGRFPPKSTILSVRINRNPYSALYDAYGSGRVEISTQPGGQTLHGHLTANATDNILNAQNPYIATVEPPYYLLNLDGSLSGSFNRKTAFFVSGVVNDQQNNAALNAVTLNAANQQVVYRQAVRDPQLISTFSLRVDRQITATHSFLSRYEFNQVSQTNGGLTAPLTLASQAFNSGTSTQTLQLADIQSFGAHIVSESRFQYIRTRLQQDALGNAPALLVEGGFNGGSNPSQSLRDAQDRFEFQQAVSIERGKHYLRFGGRYRLLRDGNLSTANYNGQWTFPSLAAYAAQQPSQFSITVGLPSATILTGDLGLYAEDEWKATPSITLDFGFRFESQSAIPDHFDPAPRLGAAWALHRKGRKSTFLLLRGGFGVFYDRFDAANLLTAVRQNGLSQQTYLLANPATYPVVPSTASLSATPPAIYRVDPHLRSEYYLTAGVSAERQIGKIGTAAVSFSELRGDHQWGSANINAPLPGTYNPSVPISGIRPFGGSQNIYEFQSNGIERRQVITFTSRLNLNKRLTAFLAYGIEHNHEDVTNATTFASNSYDLSQDYGRAPVYVQQLFVGGSVHLPLGIAGNIFTVTRGSAPFNITTGTDLNGDSIYNDRPAFATAPAASSQIYTTRFGTFDANPQPGEKIIPINYGNSPNFAYIDLSASRSFQIGRRPAAAAAVAGKPVPPRPDPPFSLTFSIDAPNVLNHTNRGQPVGVLSSPYFGQSISLNSPFTANTAANRVIFLQTSFSF
jgi:hypothetical protein